MQIITELSLVKRRMQQHEYDRQQLNYNKIPVDIQAIT
jgi:hypothetical protein